MGPLALLLACVCESPPGPAELRTWEGEDVRPALEHSFFDEHDLEPLSLYAACMGGEDRPDASHRGELGIGNGAASSLLGLGDPLTTLHNTVGPVYDKGTRFFGDHWLTLEVDGQEVDFDRECLGRPRGTSVVVTRSEAGDVVVYTVAYAPFPPDTDEREAPALLVRHVLVSSPTAHGIRLRHHAWQALGSGGRGPIEWVGDEKVLGLAAWEGAAVDDEEGWALDLGTVDGEASAVLAVGIAEERPMTPRPSRRGPRRPGTRSTPCSRERGATWPHSSSTRRARTTPLARSPAGPSRT